MRYLAHLKCYPVWTFRFQGSGFEGKVGFCKGAIVSRCCEDKEHKAGMFECAMARLLVGTAAFSLF
jgi:hypothetical protein